ncbi:hypothetical protein AMTRI_Chr02g261810 [Amborella trichopoda]
MSLSWGPVSFLEIRFFPMPSKGNPVDEYYAYVKQEDQLMGTLTIRETILFTACLRLPNSIRLQEKEALVESSITEMGLQDCADTMVGSWRLSIALEILTKPKLLFLDEPTSRLDSSTALFVMGKLHNLAREGCTIVASLFDSLYLLSGGRTIYFWPGFGDMQDCNTCSKRNNRKKKLDGFKGPTAETTIGEGITMLMNSYSNSQYCMAAKEIVIKINKEKRSALESRGSEASCLMQCFILTRASFFNMYRDIGYYWLRLTCYIIVTIAIGMIYFNVGKGHTSIMISTNKHMARTSSISFILYIITFMAIGGFPSFGEDMKVFKREKQNGHYGGAFAIWMAGLHSGCIHYIYFLLFLFASVSIAESLMMVISSIVPSFFTGIIMSACIQGAFILVSGYFRLQSNIPKPILRDYNIMLGLYQNDLKGHVFDNSAANLPRMSSDEILQYMFQIDSKRSKWLNLCAMFVMLFIYRFLFVGITGYLKRSKL